MQSAVFSLYATDPALMFIIPKSKADQEGAKLDPKHVFANTLNPKSQSSPNCRVHVAVDATGPNGGPVCKSVRASQLRQKGQPLPG